MPTPTPFITDVNKLFEDAYTRIVAARADNNYPPLQPQDDVTFRIGHEFAPYEGMAPRITIWPTDGSYDFSQVVATFQTPNLNEQIPRKQRYRRWLHFTAAMWGDNGVPLGAPISPYQDFNTALELEREFIDAMYMQATPGSFVPLGFEWIQKSDNNRYGRLLVLSFKIATPLLSEAYLTLPYSQTTGDGGVSRVIDETLTTLEGDQTSGPTIIIPE